jgi:hypothetical protein
MEPGNCPWNGRQEPESMGARVHGRESMGESTEPCQLVHGKEGRGPPCGSSPWNGRRQSISASPIRMPRPQTQEAVQQEVPWSSTGPAIHMRHTHSARSLALSCAGTPSRRCPQRCAASPIQQSRQTGTLGQSARARGLHDGTGEPIPQTHGHLLHTHANDPPRSSRRPGQAAARP